MVRRKMVSIDSATSSTTAATMPRRADGGVDPNSCVRHPEM
ncbi:Uncharacterised protein [Mycobacteroides abscessus subsp. abscessus]|nr:Uncharacterised protein [Mycobacteroides abscessus subsp. abscessus]